MTNLSVSGHKNSIVKQDLDKAHAPIEKVIDQANHAVDQAMIQRRHSFLQKICPSGATKAIIQGEIGIIESELEFRKRALQKVREAQIQASTEVLNQYLVRLKGEIRANTTEFLMTKMLDLQKSMDHIFDEFTMHMGIQLDKIEKIPNPKLKQMQEDRLDQSIEAFVDQQMQLMSKFRRIVAEEV